MFASALSRLWHACLAMVGHRRSLVAVVVAVGAGLVPGGEVAAGVTGSVTASPTTIAPGASSTVRVTATVTAGTLPGEVDISVSEGADAVGRVTITDVAVVQGSLSCERIFDVLFGCVWSNAAVGDTVAFDVTATASSDAGGPFVFSASWLNQQGLSVGGIGGDSGEDIIVVAPTSTALVSSLNPALSGEPVTFTATVSAAAAPVAAGMVTFTDETTVTTLGTVDVDGSGQASLTTSTLTTGAHQIVATFNGTAALEASVSGPITQQIDAPQADLSITKTDGVATATAGGPVTYTVTASNVGPDNAAGATIADTFPSELTDVTWTCVGAGAGSCTTAGSGDIDDTVDLPAGGSVTYTVSAMVASSATGELANTATVAAPAGVTDPDPADNSATDTDTIVATPPTSTSTTTTTTEPPTTTEQPTTTTTTTSTTTSTTSTTPTTTTSSTLPTQVDTATALTSSPNPSTLGQAVTFTATVTLADSGRPVGFRGRAAPRQVPGSDAGTLTISDGDVVLGVVAVEDGQATLTTSSLTVGRHTITAAFSGTATAAPSNVTIVQQVNQPAALPATR
jgi:uncharacterized repeat protein (TIGR01451 family)